MHGMEFTDRRTSAQPNDVAARLRGYSARTRSLGQGSHEVLVDGQVVDSIHRGVNDDGRQGYTAAESAKGWDLGGKSKAIRHVVASHDVRSNRLAGMSQAHWDFVDGK